MITAFEQFHETELPALASANGALAAPYAKGLAPIAFRVGDRASFTCAESDGALTGTAGGSDDARSWRTYTTDGTHAVFQRNNGAADSALAAGLHDDARIRRLISLSAEADRMQPNLDRNEGTKIIFKTPGATERLTDLPLHNDCGLGYHPVACPMVLVGVQLDDG